MRRHFTVAHGSGEIAPDGGTAQAADEDGEESAADAPSNSPFEDGEELITRLEDATSFTEAQLRDLPPDQRIALAKSFLEPPATDTEGAENTAERDACETLAAALQQDRDAVHTALANHEQEVFGEALMDAETFRDLDGDKAKQAVDARVKGIAKAKMKDTDPAGTAQASQSSGDPSGYGTDMFTDGGHQGPSLPTGGVFSTLAARERAQDPLNGEHPPGLFATLDAAERAQDPLNGETRSGMFATLEARERARDRRQGAGDGETAKEQAYSGSYRTGVNYAGRGDGEQQEQRRLAQSPIGGVFATLAREEAAEQDQAADSDTRR